MTMSQVQDVKVSFLPPISSQGVKQFFIEIGLYCIKCTCCADFRRKYKVSINAWGLKAQMVYTSGSSAAFGDYKLTVDVVPKTENKFLRISFIYEYT